MGKKEEVKTYINETIAFFSLSKIYDLILNSRFLTSNFIDAKTTKELV